jgi:hypothetical protein
MEPVAVELVLRVNLLKVEPAALEQHQQLRAVVLLMPVVAVVEVIHRRVVLAVLEVVVLVVVMLLERMELPTLVAVAVALFTLQIQALAAPASSS